MTNPRPAVVSDEHLTYLDELRESAITNMYGAGLYLQTHFGLVREDASTVLIYWMKTFGERHKSADGCQ